MTGTLDELIDAATDALKHFQVERLEELQLRAANFGSLLEGLTGVQETQARQRVFASVLQATEENLTFLHRVHAEEEHQWAR